MNTTRMKNKISWIIVGLLVVLACGAAWLLFIRDAPQMPASIESTNGSKYELVLPSTMQSATLNDAASLQYEDRDRELYVIVIDESKEKIASYGLDYDLETFMKISLHTLDSAGLYTYSTRMLGDNKALQTELKSTWKGQKMVYQLSCIETSSFFYRIVIWTKESWYEHNKAEMERIVKSFHESK